MASMTSMKQILDIVDSGSSNIAKRAAVSVVVTAQIRYSKAAATQQESAR